LTLCDRTDEAAAATGGEKGMALGENVESLRPAAMQSHPVMIEHVFDDPEAELRLGRDGGWEIRDGERVVHRLDTEQVRISILCKAHVFRDERHLASFEDRGMDLTLNRVVELYLDDLSARGIAAKRPGDPLSDPDWKRVLEATYPQPLSPLAADEL
jgi:hypothetical protein